MMLPIKKLFYIPYGEKKKRLVWKEIAIDFVITVWKWKVKEKVTQSCPVLCDLMNYYSPWNSPGQNTRVGSLSFLQGIFPIQGLNPGLPHCRQIFQQLSHKGSPRLCMYSVVQSLSCVRLLQPHGLQPARLLCPWDSLSKNIGVGCHFLLPGIFPTQQLKLHLRRCRQTLYAEPPGKNTY